MHDRDHYDVDRIFLSLSREQHFRIVRSSDGGRRENKRAHNSTTKVFLDINTFVSLLDSNHDGVVRMLCSPFL